MDKYDKAIAYLKENPDAIQDAWGTPDLHPAGCLFAYAGPTEKDGIGCLTQIRGYHECRTETEALTLEIKNDTRIPEHFSYITVDNLEVFAEWQRRLDKELPSRQPSEVNAQA